MSVSLQPIFAQTVGVGGVATVTFNNIPQTFTDLRLEIVARTSQTVNNTDWDITRFNGDTGTNYSTTLTSGTSASFAVGTRTASATSIQLGVFSCASSNFDSKTFGSSLSLIRDYTSSNWKQVISQGAAMSVSGTSTSQIGASLWRNTAAITSISLSVQSGNNWVEGSVFSLYGIIRPKI